MSVGESLHKTFFYLSTSVFMQLFPVRRGKKKKACAPSIFFKSAPAVVTIALFQAINHILDQVGLVICIPGNQENGGKAFFWVCPSILNRDCRALLRENIVLTLNVPDKC